MARGRLRIDGLIWLDDIVHKLATKHHVEKSEVRELLSNLPSFRFVEKGHRKGENVYEAMGRTRSGRYLITFFVLKKNHQALILSARDMSRAERRRNEI